MRQDVFLTLGSLLRQISIAQVRTQSLKMNTDHSDYDDGLTHSSRPTTFGPSATDFTGKKFKIFLIHF